MPTLATKDYYSNSVLGPEVVTIRSSDAAVKSRCQNYTAADAPKTGTKQCNLGIMIYGYLSAQFALVVTTEGAVTQLVSGVPFTGEAVPTGQMRYYSLAAMDEVSPVSIVVTPQAGDPDLFVAMSEGALRNGTYCDARATVVVESIMFTPTSPCWCRNVGCTYFFGVYGYPVVGSPTALYAIEGDARPMQLQDLTDGGSANGMTSEEWRRG